jgi:methionyl-tRNA formyltransferase
VPEVDKTLVAQRGSLQHTENQPTASAEKAAEKQPNKPISVVFFGSGPVAAKSLDLLRTDFEIEAVITKPKPAHHRGEFPVLELAKTNGFKTFTPSNKRELSELFLDKPLKSRLGIVIDYGIIIAQDVIDYFPLGIINSHFSLLPEWRGADPITFSILSGQKMTGISLMLITAGLDEGPLLAQSAYELSGDITTPELTDELIQLSHAALKEVVPLYVEGHVTPAPQEEATIHTIKQPTFSRKLTKEDGVIDWAKPAEQIEREIRAFIDWPKSRSVLAGKEVIITSSEVVQTSGVPGHAKVENKELIVHCGEKSLKIKSLKPAGKKEMSAEGFIAGYGHLLKN